MSEAENITADFVLCDELAEAMIGRKPKEGEYVTIDQKYGRTRAYVFNRDGDVIDHVDNPNVSKDIDTVHLYEEEVDKLKERNRRLKICRYAVLVVVILFATLALMVLQTLK